jgi:transposase, IS30 family
MVRGVGYRRLNAEDRVRIEGWWQAGHSQAEIARLLGRPRSAVCRELRRHRLYRWHFGAAVNARSVAMSPGKRGPYGWGYSARVAQRGAGQRAARRRPVKLAVGSPLRAPVLAMLRDRLSPKQIAGRLRREHPGQAQWQVSHETIYQALYLQGRGNLRAELADQVALRSGRTRRRARAERAGAVRSTRPWTTGLHISTRPAEAADRAVPGHWEGDLLIGARGASAIITCVERSTRFVLLGALPQGRASDAVIPVLSTLITRLPDQLRRSLAWDNGQELARHARFSVRTGCPVFFCDPRSPWQRGTNENTNGLLRQYFPRSATDFRALTQHDLDAVAAQLNRRPRQTLGFRTPAEALNEHLVALGA